MAERVTANPDALRVRILSDGEEPPLFVAVLMEGEAVHAVSQPHPTPEPAIRILGLAVCTFGGKERAEAQRLIAAALASL